MSNRSLITQRDHGKTLQQFLRDELKLSSRQAKSLLDTRAVFVNGKRIWMAKHNLRKDDLVEWPHQKKSPKPGDKINILYKDPYIIAINKAPGVISDRDKFSAESLLREQENNPEIRALHRLDKPTSGLLMFLRSSDHREAYLELFRRKEIQKTYQTLLVGQPREDQVTIRRALDGKSTETTFRVLKRHGNFCKVECTIGTGRQHQIRRHAMELGCRVAGDTQYAQQLPISPIEKSLPRQMLHAFSVEFICPHSKRKIRIHAPFTHDFQSAIKQMGLG
ncbi:RluA family pseudouridine synthase [Kiritimatiellaeota bacterium B1221]|nr:RluA family pseudouridine synthase [Kiritimatiellaeota bacterium B1221]